MLSMPRRRGLAPAAACLFSMFAAGSPPLHAQSPLWSSRDRLLELLAARTGAADRCATWRALSAGQRAVFLTTSHNLWFHPAGALPPPPDTIVNANNACTPAGMSCNDGCQVAEPGFEEYVFCIWATAETCAALGQCDVYPAPNEGEPAGRLIDHVDEVYALLDGGAPAPVGACGGADANRLFVSLDQAGIALLRSVPSPALPGLVNEWLPAPHAPFTRQASTTRGAPFGRLHYFAWDAQARPLAGRPGVGQVHDAWAADVAIDYDAASSNPLCGVNRWLYDLVWGAPSGLRSTEFEYLPSGCSGLTIDPDGATDAETGEPVTSPGRVMRVRGSGFVPGGSTLRFALGADTELGPVEPLTVGPSELTVTAPALEGEVEVWVEDRTGRRSGSELITIEAIAVSSVNAASSFAGDVALESLVSAFGDELATTTVAAAGEATQSELGGTTVAVLDRRGVQHSMSLRYVSPRQVNFVVPASTALGRPEVHVRAAAAKSSQGRIGVAEVAPGLFSAASSGSGPAAGQAIITRASGEIVSHPLARFDAGLGVFVYEPIVLGVPGEEVVHALLATGVRRARAVTVSVGGVELPVAHSGAQGSAVGLDQVNARLPPALAGRGEVEVILTADGKRSNAVKISLR